MSIGKQSKTLTNKQIEIALSYLKDRRNGIRNCVIFLLSVKGGLRAKGDLLPQVVYDFDQ